MLVRDIMTTPVLAVTPLATVEEAAALMTTRGFTTLPVVDGQGRFLGSVSECDLVGSRYPLDPRACADPDTGVLIGLYARTVAEVMHTHSWTAPPDCGLTELANRMAETRVRTVPVLNHGHVVGMVSFRDLLRGLSVAAQQT